MQNYRNTANFRHGAFDGGHAYIRRSTMMLSMTGFGRGFAESADYSVTCEIKSLNGKYFEAEIRLPRYLAELDNGIRKLLNNKLERGTVYVNFNIELKTTAGIANTENLINKPLASAYYRQIQQLSGELGVAFDNPLGELMRIPDVLVNPERSLDENLKELLAEAAENASDNLLEFRKTEGANCGNALQQCAEKIREKLSKVTQLEPERRENLRTKIYHNLEEHVKNNIADKNRLEQEILLYLEKWDIAEEIQRLSQHITYFLDCLKLEPKGRKLNFIAQEMGREMNTMGVKSNFFAIQQNVVEMKEELEKIKEQVLNIV